MNMILPTVCLLLTFAGIQANQEEVITRQLLGNKAQIQGRVQKLSDGSFEAYRGIPYAKAPIGELRFKSPVPYEIQDDTLIDGSKFGEACPQLLKSEVIGSEDCLFLNVFVPGANKGNLPVMVYFPGGTFVMGDGGLYGPEYFMSQGNVILVTVNYRLGSLGFLSLEDDTIAGNMGLKDQMEALRWVQAHIQSFGGDKDSVTIFGNSAGGISVLCLLMAEEVPLFHRAISQSAPLIDSPFMHSTHAPSYYSSILANDLGCDTETTIKTLDCLREISMAELVQKQHMFEKLFFFPSPWKPVEDFGYASKPLFKRSFAEALGHGTFRHVPILIGGTSEEGALFTPKLFANDGEKFVEISENFDILGSTLLMCIDEADVTEEDSATANIINIEYFNKENITYSSENIDKLIKMLTDVHFLGPIDKQVQLLSNSSDQPIYYYNYRYRGSHSYSLEGLEPVASHGDELFLLFKMKDAPLSKEDEGFASSLIKYWTKFATEGNPGWRPVSNKMAPQYAILNDEGGISVKREMYFTEKMFFISSTNDIIKSYRNFDLESHPAILSVMEREVEVDEEETEEEPPIREEL